MAYKTPAEIVKDILVAAGVGTFAATTGWAIYISREPISPVTAVTVTNYTGEDPDPKNLLDIQRVQVRVRGDVNGYTAARAKALAIKNALLGYTPATIADTGHLAGITMLGDINEIGYDTENHPIFTLNFRMFIEPSSGTYRT